MTSRSYFPTKATETAWPWPVTWRRTTSLPRVSGGFAPAEAGSLTLDKVIEARGRQYREGTDRCRCLDNGEIGDPDVCIEIFVSVDEAGFRNISPDRMVSVTEALSKHRHHFQTPASIPAFCHHAAL